MSTELINSILAFLTLLAIILCTNYLAFIILREFKNVRYKKLNDIISYGGNKTDPKIQGEYLNLIDDLKEANTYAINSKIAIQVILIIYILLLIYKHL